MSPNARLALFFEGVVGALERLRSNRAASLAEEARRLYRGAMTKVLTKMAYWNCRGYTPRYDLARVVNRLGLGKPADGKPAES